MGCCTRFHKTWWPGYSSEVIDPNKAFDFQRRLNIIKKALIALFIIALIACSIYLVVLLTSRGNDSNCPQNSTEKGEGEAANITNASILPLNQPEKQALKGTPIPSLDSHPQNGTTEEDNPTTATEVLPVNSTLPLSEVMHEVHVEKIKNDSTLEIINTDEPRSWCSSKKNPVECVGISKNLRTVMKFSSNMSKAPDNTTVEGFVLIKLDSDNIWHPYCYKDWTLEMGYKLCHGLGFKTLQRLTTIELHKLQDLQRRKNIPLGKDISLQTMAVVAGKNQTNQLNTLSDLDCNVGSVTCG